MAKPRPWRTRSTSHSQSWAAVLKPYIDLLRSATCVSKSGSSGGNVTCVRLDGLAQKCARDTSMKANLLRLLGLKSISVQTNDNNMLNESAGGVAAK